MKRKSSVRPACSLTLSTSASAEAGLGDIKRVLDHETQELEREALEEKPPSRSPSRQRDFQLGELLGPPTRVSNPRTAESTALTLLARRAQTSCSTPRPTTFET
jgi:hypothetical protein